MSSWMPWGPFRKDLDPLIRRSQLCILRGMAHFCARDNHDLQTLLKQAEDGTPEHLQAALQAIDKLPALHRRNLMRSFLALLNNEREHAA
jgi:hypothetical protein